MQGGKRLGAGRPPGARNKRTLQTQAAIEKSGLTPLDYMIGVMRNKKNDARVRLEAAHHAAPYVHPKLTATDLNVNAKPELSQEELEAKIRGHFDEMDSAELSRLVGNRLGSVSDALEEAAGET